MSNKIILIQSIFFFLMGAAFICVAYADSKDISEMNKYYPVTVQMAHYHIGLGIGLFFAFLYSRLNKPSTN